MFEIFCLSVFLFSVIIVVMKLESNGIIIALKPFGERDAVARIFTRQYGVLSGMLRGAGGNTKNRPFGRFFC